LGLSIVFLLLYVTVSLRQGTDGIQQHFENQKLVQENDDLKRQLAVYETLKKDYMEKQASAEDVSSYEELMGQLDLLQDKEQAEKVALDEQARDHEKKAKALNKYQQMIRNIINSNMIAKGRIKSRDELIENQDQKIASNAEDIQALEQSVAEKRAQLALGEKKIGDLNSQLTDRLKQLKNSYKQQKISQKNFEKQKKALEDQAESQIQDLQKMNKQVAQQLNAVNQQLNQTNSQLSQAEQDITKLGQEKAQIAGELQNSKAGFAKQIQKLQSDFDAQRGKDRGDFERALARERLTGDQKAEREKQFKLEADRKAKQLAGQIAALSDKMKATEGELARAQENLNAKKKLVQQIQKNFAAAGVKADVDANTGDVILSFGNHFFDTDRSVLKPQMLDIIKQTMPAYSKSLFQDAQVSKKIQNVEIVGFASPTYQGKYVDPRSLKESDRKAINYNLDLSYARAKAIFNVIFDQNKMTFQHQKDLLPLVKVTGRSFLANSEEQSGVASDTHKSFCEKNDCAKLQKVIIKFNLKD
jgi:chromosome segregation ATPase